MTLKERISEIFDKYSVQLEVQEKAEVKFAVATLDSGQEIQTDADAFAVGASVFVVNDEGEQIPLPDGEYTLADGSMIVVAEGAIVEVNEGSTEPEVEAEEDKEEEMAAEEVEASSDVLTREEVLGMINEAIEATKAEFSSQIKERDSKITELSKQATKSLSRAPKMEAPKPVDLKKLSITERVAAIHNQFSK